MMTEQVNQLEKLLTVLSLGLCVAIKKHAIDINEAEQLLYSPFTMNTLDEFGANKALIELIHAGTELEDLESLMPSELTKSIVKMEEQALNFLSCSPKNNPQLEKWLSKYLTGKSENEYVMLKQA